MVLKYVFFVFILDAVFCGTKLFIFQDNVWLVKKSWWVHCCSTHQDYWFSDRCGSEFALWWFFVQKNCRHKLVASTSFWSCFGVFLEFWHLWKTQRQFFVLLMRCRYAVSPWEYKIFNFVIYVSEIRLFCVHLWCDFLWYKFFYFPGQCVAR